MLLAEKLGVSAFTFLPHSAKQGILYKPSLFWAELLDQHQERRECITWFRQERVPFASWERSTGQRSWRRIVSWTV